MSERQLAFVSILTAMLPGLMVWWRTSPGAVTTLLGLGCVMGLLNTRLRRAERTFDTEDRRLRDG